MKAKTYKQLVNQIAEIKTQQELDQACWDADRSFEADKITWNDHESLFKILAKIQIYLEA